MEMVVTVVRLESKYKLECHFSRGVQLHLYTQVALANMFMTMPDFSSIILIHANKSNDFLSCYDYGAFTVTFLLSVWADFIHLKLKVKLKIISSTSACQKSAA